MRPVLGEDNRNTKIIGYIIFPLFRCIAFTASIV